MNGFVAWAWLDGTLVETPPETSYDYDEIEAELLRKEEGDDDEEQGDDDEQQGDDDEDAATWIAAGASAIAAASTYMF